MPELPSGAVTFLFSDIEGSTRLLKAQRERYPKILAEHRQIVRDAIERHNGHEIDTQGDAFFMVFAHAKQAVMCALAVDRDLAAHSWPGGATVKVRIGIHTGQATPVDGSYAGLSVHRAARICSAANGGQVLISQATQTILEDEEEALAFTLRDIGVRKLKDLDRSVQLFEVLADTASLGTSGGRAPPVSEERAIAEERLRRIIVLPFANISPDPDDEYFADGMTEELIERLAHVSGLSVIARTTAMHYKNTAETTLQIGRELRVGMVLESSVRKAGTRLRVTAQLIDTETEEHLWASHYDRELDDVFAIQDDIAGEIVKAISGHVASLGVTLRLGAAATQHDTADMEAYTEFLHARQLLREKYSESTIRQSLSLFERAIDRDPGFARARVGVAECLEWLGTEGALPFEETTRRARVELHRALSINDGLEEAHSVLAGSMLGNDETSAAKREAMRAIELNPNFSSPYRWLAQIAAGEGSIGEAIRLLEHAYSVDPLDVDVMALLDRSYFYGGRIDRALEFWDRTEPLLAFRVNSQRAEYYLGRHDDRRAEACLNEMRRTRPGNLRLLLFEGLLAAQRGDTDGAQRAVQALNSRSDEGDLTFIYVGYLQFGLGNVDQFFSCMDKALEMRQLPLLE